MEFLVDYGSVEKKLNSDNEEIGMMERSMILFSSSLSSLKRKSGKTIFGGFKFWRST